MIELAPMHKTGLPIKSPIMPAAGFFGYGQPLYVDLIRADQFGAIVTNPITLRPLPHYETPQLAETYGGVVVNTPPRNPGVKQIIRRYEQFWRRAAAPVIAHLPLDNPEDIARTAGALAGLDLLAGLELGLPRGTTPKEARTAVTSINQRSELPLLVKLPNDGYDALADVTLEYGADGLVFGMPPYGVAATANNLLLEGDYFGAGIMAQHVPSLIQLHERYPDIPLIASGGIHTLADIQTCLQAGAIAVQLDVMIFIDPKQVAYLLGKYQT